MHKGRHIPSVWPYVPCCAAVVECSRPESLAGAVLWEAVVALILHSPGVGAPQYVHHLHDSPVASLIVSMFLVLS